MSKRSSYLCQITWTFFRSTTSFWKEFHETHPSHVKYEIFCESKRVRFLNRYFGNFCFCWFANLSAFLTFSLALINCKTVQIPDVHENKNWVHIHCSHQSVQSQASAEFVFDLRESNIAKVPRMNTIKNKTTWRFVRFWFWSSYSRACLK